MGDYETEISRQPRGPFSRVPERQLIRRVAEHWSERQRYSAERRRRFSTWGWWFGLIVPFLLGAIKVVEAVFSNGSH